MRNFSLKTATRQEIDAYVQSPLPFTSYVFKVMEDDVLLAFIGFYRKDNVVVLFSSVLPFVYSQLKRYKRAFVFAYRSIMPLLESVHLPIAAAADPEIDGSAKFLTHYGFRHYKEDTYVRY